MFACESSQRNGDFRVIFSETSIEVGETEEGLYVFDFVGFRPLEDSFDFAGVHGKSIWRQNITKIFDCVLGELTFLYFGIKVVLS